MTNKEFAERLTELRIQKGVSSREMSLDLGQSASYVNNIENGCSLPSMNAFFIICDYFGITPSEFFDREDADPKQSSELYNAIKKLPRETASALQTILDNMK